jgi:hypothetical protein
VPHFRKKESKSCLQTIRQSYHFDSRIFSLLLI